MGQEKVTLPFPLPRAKPIKLCVFASMVQEFQPTIILVGINASSG